MLTLQQKNNMEFWNIKTEQKFFKEALKSWASPEQLFYKLKQGTYAYVPKGMDAEGKTLQSRNSLIGHYTEQWCKALMEPIARKYGLYAINGVVCEEIGLTKTSSADLAFCTKNKITQEAKDIKIIFEIKMSIVSNYEYIRKSVNYIGDYKTHKGTPSLLRSDSMLKAIGKAINIRVSGRESVKIPIVILGNSPITENYFKKVDYLRENGVIQYFLSLNPQPTTGIFIERSPNNAFITVKTEKALENICKELLNSDLYYFSSMISKKSLGSIIKTASKETTDIARANKFLSLINA